jgi:hypothetical protein
MDYFVADAIPVNIETMVATEFAWLDSFFKAQQKAA